MSRGDEIDSLMATHQSATMMHRFYRGVLYLVLPLVWLRLLRRARSEPEYGLRRAERFGAVPESVRSGCIWVHTVSAGETIAAAPLIAELAAEFEALSDDYNSIMVKAIADRLAEAFAEYLHQQVRQHWGYGTDEALSNEELITESYRGIRPAPGYPAQPDHTEKATIWKLLDVEENIGVKLTESYAMMPAASVSGLYFAHPESRYFAVDRITRDQIESYAQRKGMSIQEVERWLAPVLGY